MTEQLSIQDLIGLYDLQPHPEGGYFKETYRSKESLLKSSLPQRFTGDRSASTAIYFLIPAGKKSLLHRIQSDEIWHFYLGGPLTLIQISPDGKLEQIILGKNIKIGHKLQHVVPHGVWFGAYPNPETQFSFVGCTVAPGFDFTDFEMGIRSNLLKKYPHEKDKILFLTN